MSSKNKKIKKRTPPRTTFGGMEMVFHSAFQEVVQNVHSHSFQR
jgi:hypothetical protein